MGDHHDYRHHRGIGTGTTGRGKTCSLSTECERETWQTMAHEFRIAARWLVRAHRKPVKSNSQSMSGMVDTPATT
jgi:hypothetical protein